MKKYIGLVLVLFFAISPLFAQQPERVEPPFWWTDMPVEEFQIQLYGDEIGHFRASINHPGVTLLRQQAVDSPNYLFLYVQVDATTEPGPMDITLKRGRKTVTVDYELRERESGENRNQGFDNTDVIYLMMPDRFANGDPSNDSIEGMLETADRSNPERRQGGDIQGIMDHLDYIDELGMTAIWFTPLFENDMTPEYGGYHGYAATDLYRVDRRYGTNEEYKALIDAAHDRGMKVIMDMIHNHIGDQHWWMNDLPTADWVHSWEEYGQTNYRGAVVSDPYASEYDHDKLVNGWFVKEMPDLNQDIPLLNDYLIINTLWWIEYTGVDGIRMDTYVYPDKEYMARWAKEVMEAYPDFNIVGEAWVNNVPAEAFWQYDPEGVDDGYDSNLPSLTDFQFAFAARDAFNEDFGWSTGLSKLYYLLSQDFQYADADANVTFLDNHDMSRVYEHIGKNKEHFLMAYAFLMTTRGVPQVYYGTELMMAHENRGGDDEAWRQTMPGGFPDDERSVFTREGRTDLENEIFEHISALTNWRKTAIAIHEGQLVHFIPENNVYVYFRVHQEQTIMVVLNGNDNMVDLELERFDEITDAFRSGTEVLNGKAYDLSEKLPIQGKKALILELK